ncbi:MAG: carboxypeptidase-like regulatory domain-containing protein, partial [Bacteroidales bacterium]|nr:carboxypeptidase-like regulatory domain-containing protein [Bacteroidales bacterium]
MKTRMVYTLLSLFSPLLVAGQTTHISGRVVDAGHNPVPYANIYIVNSVEGTSSDDDGNFRFETLSTGVKQLAVSMIGYEDYLLEEDVAKMHALTIMLKEIPLHLDEVVVQVGSFIIKGTSSIENKGSVDVATTAGSEGDLFKALTLLPGAQATGTDGRLLIRGGNSSESQTYIDDMHVLSPYGATSPHQQARS